MKPLRKLKTPKADRPPLPLRHPQSSARSPDLPKSEKIKCFTVPQRVA
jgi:hypothetical protein